MEKLTHDEMIELSKQEGVISSKGGGGGATIADLGKTYDGTITSEGSVNLDDGRRLLLSEAIITVNNKKRNITFLWSEADQIGQKITVIGTSYKKKDSNGNKTDEDAYSFNVIYREQVTVNTVTKPQVINSPTVQP